MIRIAALGCERIGANIGAGHKAVHDAVRTGDQVVVTTRDPGLAPEAYLKVSGGILTPTGR